MGNSTKPISELVEEVARHDLVLPEMQRRYVWRSTQVRDLFDSLYRGYPVGSILVWERPFGEEARNLDVGEAAGARRSGQKLLLLDGQQRLTSLTSIIKDVGKWLACIAVAMTGCLANAAVAVAEAQFDWIRR